MKIIVTKVWGLSLLTVFKIYKIWIWFIEYDTDVKNNLITIEKVALNHYSTLVYCSSCSGPQFSQAEYLNPIIRLAISNHQLTATIQVLP